MKTAIAIAALSALGCLAFADVVHLKNGGTLEGQVVEEGNQIVIKLPVGEVRVSRDAVQAIEKKPGALAEYQKRVAATKDDDPQAHYKLGVWALSVGLKRQAEEEFKKTIALDPDHAAAHKALGHRLVGGRWMSEDDEMKARGLVNYKGEWMTPEAAARLRTLEAELELAREKRKAAELELQKTKEQLKAQQPNMPTYTTTNPYDEYYSTRQLRRPYTYYWITPDYSPSYIGPSYWLWYRPYRYRGYYHHHRHD